jgi:hypothetical protein
VLKVSKKRVNWLKKMLTIMAWLTFIVVVTVAVLGRQRRLIRPVAN